jgi:selenocysteine-specific elongation factor
VTPAADRVQPASTGAVRLRLEQPVVARWGDRAVVRSYSPMTTIGGAIVAEPWPPGRPRRPEGLERLLGRPEDRVLAAIARAGAQGLAVADLPVRLGIPPSQVEAVLRRLEADAAVRVADRMVAADRVRRLRERAVRLIAAHHDAEPLAPGMPREALRQALGDPALADHVLDHLASAGEVVVEGAVARLPAHAATLDDAAEVVAETLASALRKAGAEGLTAGELAEASGNSRGATTVLEYMTRVGSVARVGRERYYDAAVLARMVERVGELLRERAQVGPADLRDAFGLTRKFSIPLLEWLDGQGYTVRVGDVRRAGPRLTSTSKRP